MIESIIIILSISLALCLCVILAQGWHLYFNTISIKQLKVVNCKGSSLLHEFVNELIRVGQVSERSVRVMIAKHSQPSDRVSVNLTSGPRTGKSLLLELIVRGVEASSKKELKMMNVLMFTSMGSNRYWNKVFEGVKCVNIEIFNPSSMRVIDYSKYNFVLMDDVKGMNCNEGDPVKLVNSRVSHSVRKLLTVVSCE